MSKKKWKKMCDCNSQSIFLFRFTELLDSVLHYLLPSWNYSAGSFKDLEVLHTLFVAAEMENVWCQCFVLNIMSSLRQFNRWKIMIWDDLSHVKSFSHSSFVCVDAVCLFWNQDGISFVMPFLTDGTKTAFSPWGKFEIAWVLFLGLSSYFVVFSTT